MKKVLVLCTGNSCRSIIGEALINAYLENVSAKSAGVSPNGKVNQNAKKVLQEHSIWDDDYNSKHLNDLIEEEFDLVVTVCDGAKESCPVFPKTTKTLHVSFEDPDGKDYSEFKKTFTIMRDNFLPKIKDAL